MWANLRRRQVAIGLLECVFAVFGVGVEEGASEARGYRW
jgi:hypothetical protein